MDCSPPGSSVHGILHEEYWSGLPGPPPSDLPHPGSNLCPLWLLHWQTGSLPLAPPGKPFIPSTQVQFLGRELRSCFKPPLTAVSLRSDGGPPPKPAGVSGLSGEAGSQQHYFCTFPDLWFTVPWTPLSTRPLSLTRTSFSFLLFFRSALYIHSGKLTNSLREV